MADNLNGAQLAYLHPPQTGAAFTEAFLMAPGPRPESVVLQGQKKAFAINMLQQLKGKNSSLPNMNNPQAITVRYSSSAYGSKPGLPYPYGTFDVSVRTAKGEIRDGIVSVSPLLGPKGEKLVEVQYGFGDNGGGLLFTLKNNVMTCVGRSGCNESLQLSVFTHMPVYALGRNKSFAECGTWNPREDSVPLKLSEQSKQLLRNGGMLAFFLPGAYSGINDAGIGGDPTIPYEKPAVGNLLLISNAEKFEQFKASYAAGSPEFEDICSDSKLGYMKMPDILARLKKHGVLLIDCLNFSPDTRQIIIQPMYGDELRVNQTVKILRNLVGDRNVVLRDVARRDDDLSGPSFKNIRKWPAFQYKAGK